MMLVIKCIIWGGRGGGSGGGGGGGGGTLRARRSGFPLGRPQWWFGWCVGSGRLPWMVELRCWCLEGYGSMSFASEGGGCQIGISGGCGYWFQSR